MEFVIPVLLGTPTSFAELSFLCFWDSKFNEFVSFVRSCLEAFLKNSWLVYG